MNEVLLQMLLIFLTSITKRNEMDDHLKEFETEKYDSFKPRKRNWIMVVLLIILVWAVVRAWRKIVHY